MALKAFLSLGPEYPSSLLVSLHCQGKDNSASSHFPVKVPGPVLTLLVTWSYLSYGYLH